MTDQVDDQPTKLPDPVLILGIPIDRVTMEQAVCEIARLVDLGRRRGTAHQVVTVNADFLMHAVGDPQLHRILATADLALADGMPLVWATRRLGMPIAGRVTGADLVPALAAHSAVSGTHLHLFGATDGVAARAAEMLIGQHPGAVITADAGGRIGDPLRPAPGILDSISEVGADIVCLALSHPAQERFIAANRDQLGAPVLIGVGGTLDLLVGVRHRAPQAVQRLGLEWAFRAAQEPRRLGKRYAKNILVLGPRLLRDVAKVNRSAPRTAGAPLDVGSRPIDLIGRDALSIGDAGALVGASRAARQSGEEVRVVNVSDALSSQLGSLGALPLIDVST